MGRIFRSTMNMVYAGVRGDNEAVPFRLCPKLNDVVSGTARGEYYLYGAETGVGKTKFVRDQHMYNVYDHYQKTADDNKLDVRFLDFSLEMTKEQNMIMAIIRKVYLDDGKYIAYKRAIGKDLTRPLTKEETDLMESKEKYFDGFEKKLTVYEDVLTPTEFSNALLKHFRAHGKFANDDGNNSKPSTLGEYTPNNPRLLTVAIFDTINLADNETGQTNKQSIDRISKIALTFRNKCNLTPIIIQQFNADNSEITRQRHGVKTPMLRDFEDSKRTTKDANVVIGLWDPKRYGEETFRIGQSVYDIVQLQSWFVSAHVLKNRTGETNKVAPLRFNGAIGTFTEFPAIMQPEDYARLTKL